MSEGKNISRRDFLKMGAILTGAIIVGGGGGYLLGRSNFQSTPGTEPRPTLEPLSLTPEVVDGVKVYGLKEEITSLDDVDRFYAYLNDESSKIDDVKISNVKETMVKQRAESLNPNERYLEVVVRRSAYESFVQKRFETGISFPGWIQAHVDVMNRCMEAAKPPLNMKAILRRIVVVDDDAIKKIWDEKAYREGKNVALDVKWGERFEPYSFDTDMSWAVADDYRAKNEWSFWEIRHENDKTIIGTPPEKTSFDLSYEFPEENDSLLNKNNLNIDMGMIHEWSHRLLNLPDEYAQDVHDKSQRFKDFTFGTGSFQIPYFSPYLSYLMTENIEIGARDYFIGSDRVFTCFSEHPEEVGINVQSQSSNLTNGHIEASPIILLDNSYYGRKSVSQDMKQVSASNYIKFEKNLFQVNSNCWLIKLVDDGVTREVFLPAAALNMSKISGLESVKYNLTFSGYDDPERTYQEVKLVDETEVDEYIKDSKDPYYAKMKVEGTGIWFIWFLRA